MWESSWPFSSGAAAAASSPSAAALEGTPTHVLNKDHQRMMVDPMLMIVLDLRSFLTAVTPTAVAPTAVIFFFN